MNLLSRFAAAFKKRVMLVKATSFALVGVVNFAVDFGVFSFAYYRLGLTVIAANIAAWVVAVTCSYILNTLITFAAESGRRLRIKDYFAFALSQTGGFIANTAVVFVCSHFMHVLLGKVLAIGASFLVNFTLSHFVVFRKRKPAER
jgi:putative flippase GtrA